ncbi:hypothetical protein [Neisseria zoodegmatis]|nr:hypothetical protein [Neisseria zoodegmatis]
MAGCKTCHFFLPDFTLGYFKSVERIRFKVYLGCFVMPNSEQYQAALQQIEALISHLRQHQSTDCALAEKEDALLIRLADWKTDLKPGNHKAIAEIGRYYQQLILSGGQA